MTEKKDISKMSPEEKKAMNKECEMAERKVSRIKHCDVQEEYKPFFSGISDAFVKRFGITSRMINNELSHPLTSSTEAFDGKFASATGSILFHRSLFAQFGYNFNLKKLLEWMAECIKKGFFLQISIIDPSHPDGKPIKSFDLFFQEDTTLSKKFWNKMLAMRDKFKTHVDK